MANKSKLTPEMKSKIEEVAALDGSVKEMAYYCDVSHQTIYNWFEEDPELFERVERLRERPILKARQTISKSLETPQGAQWYLARKKKKEFSERIEQTGADGEPLAVTITTQSQELADKYEEELRIQLLNVNPLTDINTPLADRESDQE